MNPYQRFQNEELILRDELAIDRTILANERTLLAYLRSALTLILAGITFVHFGREANDQHMLLCLGLTFLPAGILVALFGGHRYRAMGRAICTVRRDLEASAAAADVTDTPAATTQP